MDSSTPSGRLLPVIVTFFSIVRRATLTASTLLLAAPLARAGEHITLRNGAEFDCTRHEPQGKETIRLFLRSSASNENYIDVPARNVLTVETVPEPPAPQPTAAFVKTLDPQPATTELHQLLTRAGSAHNIDAELLAAVVHAESNGFPHAVSRTGARGLMQLMPGTAAVLGVHDAFVAQENVDGGTRYLDALLTRYHDNITLALAAYNAGPAAVDRFHGVPPFRETRAYVARVIGEFNRRKSALLTASATPLAK